MLLEASYMVVLTLSNQYQRLDQTVETMSVKIASNTLQGKSLLVTLLNVVKKSCS